MARRVESVESVRLNTSAASTAAYDRLIDVTGSPRSPAARRCTVSVCSQTSNTEGGVFTFRSIALRWNLLSCVHNTHYVPPLAAYRVATCERALSHRQSWPYTAGLEVVALEPERNPTHRQLVIELR